MKRFRITWILALMLTGCSLSGGLERETGASERWQQHQLAVAAVDRWDLRARAAVNLPGESYQVGIRWLQADAAFRLVLEAPFGQGVILIERESADSYRLALPDGRVFVDRSPEALLDAVLGWSIPISGMEYWIRGMPHPDSEFNHRAGDDGQARWISQDRWAIDYLDYFDQQPALPRKVALGRDDMRLKVVIERWQQADIEEAPSDLFPEFN